MGVDGSFAECKAYSPAFCFGLRVGAHLERGEDVVELAKRDANPLVLDGECDEIRSSLLGVLQETPICKFCADVGF